MEDKRYELINEELERLFPGAEFTIHRGEAKLFLDLGGGGHKNKKKRKCEITFVLDYERNPPVLLVDSLHMSTKMAISDGSYAHTAPANLKGELRRLADKCLKQRLDEAQKLIDSANADDKIFMDFLTEGPPV